MFHALSYLTINNVRRGNVIEACKPALKQEYEKLLHARIQMVVLLLGLFWQGSVKIELFVFWSRVTELFFVKLKISEEVLKILLSQYF